jgi:putative transposase
MLYHAHSLPTDVKATIARHETDKAPKKIIEGAVIPDWSHRIGLARYQVVSAWRSFCGKNNGKKTEATEAFLSAYNSGQIADEAFGIIGGLQKSSLYRWAEILRDNGDDYYSICDQRGKWTRGGPKGLGQLTPEAQEAFLSIWLTPNQPGVALAHAGMTIALNKIGQDVPSLSSTHRFARRFAQVHHDLVTLKREGEKALNDKVSGWIPRNPDLLEVGDCIFADGHTLNFECIHPATGKPFRPTLIVWFDWKSAMPVGWEVMPTENVIAISSALYMAIVNLGKIPKVPYLVPSHADSCGYNLASLMRASLVVKRQLIVLN